MTKVKIKDQGTPRFAPLKNLSLLHVLVERLVTRKIGTPGFGVFYGFSGYGKTYASIYAQNRTGGPLVEVRDTWRARAFLEALLDELGAPGSRGTVAQLERQAIEILSEPGHPPLFIDEADKLVDKGMIELVRGIQEAAQVPVVLIGEELLPAKLERSERTHNRVLDFVPAVPCDDEDTAKLATVRVPHLTLSPGLLTTLRAQSEGRARRIVTSLDRIEEWALARNVSAIDEGYDGGFMTGRTPPRRRVA